MNLVTKEDLNFFAPGVIYSYEYDFNIRVKIAQEFLRGGMKAEGGGNQIQQRRCGGKFTTLEVSKLLKLVSALKPIHSQPVIQPLEREVDFFMDLKFHYRKTPPARGG